MILRAFSGWAVRHSLDMAMLQHGCPAQSSLVNVKMRPAPVATARWLNGSGPMNPSIPPTCSCAIMSAGRRSRSSRSRTGSTPPATRKSRSSRACTENSNGMPMTIPAKSFADCARPTCFSASVMAWPLVFCVKATSVGRWPLAAPALMASGMGASMCATFNSPVE